MNKLLPDTTPLFLLMEVDIGLEHYWVILLSFTTVMKFIILPYQLLRLMDHN